MPSNGLITKSFMFLAWIFLPLFFYPLFSWAQEEMVETPPAPPTEVRAYDKPNDSGGIIVVEWTKSRDDLDGEEGLYEYVILRSDGGGQFDTAGVVESGNTSFEDMGVEDGINYIYQIFFRKGTSLSSPSTAAEAEANDAWFNADRTTAMIMLVVFLTSLLWFIDRARKGKPLFIRKIAGLNALDEAIGRATEMGRKILYVAGIMDIDDTQTIASMSILGHVAKMTAEYGTQLDVPNCMPLTMTTAREVVKEAYLKAGHPEDFNENMVYYVTFDQFAYAAALMGKMVREQPAANFLIGYFFAESLLLAETGQATGAIQIAGTALPDQLPFFVVTCDYTLIGEEMFAASAYLSREPLILGSIKGSDLVKALIIVVILVGIGLETVGVGWFKQLFILK